MRFWIFVFTIAIFSQAQTKAAEPLALPEALFSNDGKYSLVYTYDSLNHYRVDAWTLYLNATNEELSIIIPKGDSVYFVSYVIDRNYFPYFVTDSGDTLSCKVVNILNKESFLSQYQLYIRPLELARKIRYQIDTTWYSVVQLPYTDSILEYKFLVNFMIDTHHLMLDSVMTNLDSTVYIVKEYEDPFEQLKLYYSPGTNYYWMKSAIYSEKLRFKEQQYYTDTVIVSEFHRGISHQIKFGKLYFPGI